MTLVVRQTLALLASRSRPLLALVALVNVPYYLLFKGAVYWGWLPSDAADVVFGFIALLIGPVTNATVVHLLHMAKGGINVPLKDGLACGIRVFPRMLAAYIALSFVVLGWLAVTVLPGAGLLMLLDLKSPYLLAPFGAVGLLLALPPYAFLDSVLVVDGLEAWRARQVSRDLTRGRRLKIVGFGLIALIPAVAMEILADQGPAHLAEIFAGSSLALAVCLGVLSSAFYFVPVALFYVLYGEARFPTPHEETSQ